MWIEREISELIQKVTVQRPCVVLTGARQTGKTSLAEKLLPAFNYVSLDVPSRAAEAKENGIYFLERNQAPLIVDEIQYAPELFRPLKVMIDRKRNLYGQYFLTGSQKYSLMQEVSESLSGRVSIIECHSLSIRELQRHTQEPLSTNLILKWMIQGGYPEIHANQLDPRRFYGDYLATYLERDVRKMINVRNLMVFDKFLRLLSLQSGQVLNMNSLSVGVGVSAHTIKSWLSVLEAGNIIYLLKPYYRNFRKRLVKSPKIYFLDTGLLCFLAGFGNEKSLEGSSLLGAFFETLAVGQLVRHFSNCGEPVNLYYYRDNHGHEMDLIVPEGDRMHIYEIKWKHESGRIPDNIVNFKKIAGDRTILSSKVITSADSLCRIGDRCSVTTLTEL